MNFLVSSPRDVSYRVFSPGDLGAEEERGTVIAQRGPAWGPPPVIWTHSVPPFT